MTKPIFDICKVFIIIIFSFYFYHKINFYVSDSWSELSIYNQNEQYKILKNNSKVLNKSIISFLDDFKRPDFIYHCKNNLKCNQQFVYVLDYDSFINKITAEDPLNIHILVYIKNNSVNSIMIEN